MEVPKNPTPLSPVKKKVERRFLLWLLGLCVLVALGWFAYTKWRQPDTQPQTLVPDTTLNKKIVLGVKRTEVDPGVIPSKFPQDIPSETGSVVVQNYLAEAQNGESQAVREYETKRKPAENEKLFKDYLTKSGWVVTAELKPEVDAYLLNAAKDSQYFTVTISENSITKKPTVKLLITYFVLDTTDRF